MSGSRQATQLASISLDPAREQPLQRQLYERLRIGILRGQLEPRLRLPASRQLADSLGVSRTTVVNAYEQLKAEGYLQTRVGAGTFVSDQLPEELAEVRHARLPDEARHPGGDRSLSQRGQRIHDLLDPDQPQPYFQSERVFAMGTPDLSAFPFERWRALRKRVERQLSPWRYGYGEPLGYEPLRQEIASYLKSSRGVRCEPDQILISSGSQQGLYLVGSFLLDAGDGVWLENPGYPGARRALRSLGIEPLAAPVDAEGLSITHIRASQARARAAYVTPSHQFPLGHVMSLPRRLELLRWATDNDAWILEDDYDSEFRYRGQPVPALQGLDARQRVIYLGTFSKVLFPSLRLGYLVLPADLMHAARAARSCLDLQPPLVSQATLAAFINEGHFARHVRRMRVHYRERCETVVSVLESELPPGCELGPYEAGMHLVLWLPHDLDEWQAARRAAAHDVQTAPLSLFAARPLDRSALVLGFSGAEVAALAAGARRLAHALRTLSQSI